jgi:glycosyltransferase involved in cell wall biosynthesis
MKIGIIGRSIPPFDRGGIQTHIAELSKALAAKGIDTHVFIVGRGSKNPGKEIKEKRYHVHPIPCMPLPKLTIGEYLSYSLNCARHIKRHDLDMP